MPERARTPKTHVLRDLHDHAPRGTSGAGDDDPHALLRLADDHQAIVGCQAGPSKGAQVVRQAQATGQRAAGTAFVRVEHDVLVPAERGHDDGALGQRVGRGVEHLREAARGHGLPDLRRHRIVALRRDGRFNAHALRRVVGEVQRLHQHLVRLESRQGSLHELERGVLVGARERRHALRVVGEDPSPR